MSGGLCRKNPMGLQVPVIGILRGIDGVFFSELLAASFAAGLQAVELTMNTPGAEEIVARCRSQVVPGTWLGMGTIRTLEEAKRAVGAGAMFLVTPNFDPAVIACGRDAGLPVIAGGLTPTEVFGAHAAGATMVKVFPCGSLGGPAYLKELAGPFDHLPLVPVGGVTAANVREYFAAGAVAVGVGGSLFGKEALAGRRVEAVARNVKKFIDLVPLLEMGYI